MNENRSSNELWTETKYVYDGANGVEEVNASGAVVARYVQGAGIDEPLAQSRSELSYYNADGLGSITSLTDSTGTPTATFVYGAFGVLNSSTGTTANSYRYTAREYDTETGLYYYRARYYDSANGRFLSEDPNIVGVARSMYSYVDGGPAGFTDPLGFGKQKPVPSLQPGVSDSQASAILKGFNQALNRLKGGPCAKFFGCDSKAPSNPAVTELAAIEWGVFTDKKHPSVMAHTYTNADRAEFNTASTVFDNGEPVWRSPNRNGFSPRYVFGDSESLLAFYMLHELAHHFPKQTGFQLDAGPGLEDVNEQNSLLLIKACFRDATRMTK